MSDTRCEQHPLLYDDLSEEEQFGTSVQRRYMPMVFRGRAKNKVKGAAAVIKLWPGHWSSSLTYWWIGLAMIAIVTFIIYNSIAALAIPTNHFRGIKTRIRNNTTAGTVAEQNPEFPNVYMHLFVDNNKEVDLNSYLPYIEIIAAKYANFNYKLYIITNDTNDITTNIISAEENNEIALNFLWTNNKVHPTPKRNINIEHITLSKYMQNSPLGKYWRTLPNEFIEFLARAVSIWDKGGISFNPVILTPRSPHAIYIEKLQNILRNYPQISKRTTKELKKPYHENKKKVNNIRDIIDALERESGELPSTDQSLEAAENKNTVVVTGEFEKLNYYEQQNKFNNTKFDQNHDVDMSNDTNARVSRSAGYPSVNKMLNKIEVSKPYPVLESGSQIDHSKANDTTTFGLLPMFLDFLFEKKPFASVISSRPSKEEPKIVTRKRKHVLPPISKRNKILSSTDDTNDNTKPIIISANFSTNHDLISVNETESYSQLTIDLKGNLIASVTSCHAFLGTIFSNLVHHSQESLTEFIINELSIFCKGVLSSCYGIDIILL